MSQFCSNPSSTSAASNLPGPYRYVGEMYADLVLNDGISIQMVTDSEIIQAAIEQRGFEATNNSQTVCDEIMKECQKYMTPSMLVFLRRRLQNVMEKEETAARQ